MTSVTRLHKYAMVGVTLVALFLYISQVLNEADAVKVDCYPLKDGTKEKCEALGCIWSPVEEPTEYTGWSNLLPDFSPPANPLALSKDKPRVDEPWCYHPDGYKGYLITSTSNNTVHLTRTRPSAFGSADVKNLALTVRPYKMGQLLRITIRDAEGLRFVPELPKLRLGLDNNEYDGDEEDEINETGEQFYFDLAPLSGKNANQILTIRRATTHTVVFSTDLGKLIFSDKFIQLNTALSSPFVYGLGEHYDTFLKWANEYKVYSFWNTDRLTLPGGTRSYGGFPYLINLEMGRGPVKARAHGLYLRNSNAMDVVLQNDLSVTFRPIGGILDFFLLSGPTPLEVTRQFQHLVGLPELPARWGLGFHLCRYNYLSLARTRLISERTSAAGIPFDVQWNDVDAMERSNDFSINSKSYAGLDKFVDELHARHMHYIPLIDPGISQEPNYYPYELGTQMDIWIRNATNQTLVARVWNQSGRTVFPDFSNPKSHEYWEKMFVEYQKKLKFDGAWIDMNDISSFVDGSLDGCPSNSALETPPYLPGGYNLQAHSICLSAQQMLGTQYDMHNLYSSYEAMATKRALQAARPGRRSVIISRSTHPGQGAHSGHWSGDVQATWDYLRWSIPQLLEYSMYGFTMAGSDICGFAGNTTPELCARWSSVGAFYTFSRNHNDDTSIDQDPVALGPDVVGANKNAFTKRYALMPYLYTLVYKAHKLGEPVARSVGFEFFDQHDKEALRVEDQFMWGRAVMLSPIVTENTFSKATYLPQGRWYELDTLPESSSFNASLVRVPKLIDAPFGMTNWYKTNNVTLVNMPIFYRGGHVLPVYAQVKATIFETENDQPLSLEVALCRMGRAEGDAWLDDGESIQDATSYLRMSAADGKLSVQLLKDDYKKQVKLGYVKVLGVNLPVKQVAAAVGGDQTEPRTTLNFSQKDHMLIVSLETLPPVEKGKGLVITWS